MGVSGPDTRLSVKGCGCPREIRTNQDIRVVDNGFEMFEQSIKLSTKIKSIP